MECMVLTCTKIQDEKLTTLGERIDVRHIHIKYTYILVYIYIYTIYLYRG